MVISLDDLTFLASAAGERLLARLAEDDLAEERSLALLSSLRREVTPSQAGALLELAQLRQRGVDKFGAAALRMFFTREALEQASDPLVRTYRAHLAGETDVVDACCSIGADSLAFAEAGASVLGLDIDPVRIAMARLNAEALAVQARFEVGDVREGIPAAQLAFFDPARRDSGGRRLHHVEGYEPPLSTVRGWAAAQVAVKLAPGVALEELVNYGGLVEFISVGGALKEATLWWQPGAESMRLRAVLLTANAVHVFDGGADSGAETRGNGPAGHAMSTPEPAGQPPEKHLSAPGGWLLEPDPAILRAGLVTDLADALGARQMDGTIAYLTSDDLPESPWVRAWRVLDWMPFNVKRLRAYLRERGVGTVTVKKRGSAVTPEALQAQLKLKGSEARTLVLTRHEGKPVVLVCEEGPRRSQA